MKTQPELVPWILPFGLSAGISLAIGVRTGNIVAWCIASASLAVCLLSLWAALQHLRFLRRPDSQGAFQGSIDELLTGTRLESPSPEVSSAKEADAVRAFLESEVKAEAAHLESLSLNEQLEYAGAWARANRQRFPLSEEKRSRIVSQARWKESFAVRNRDEAHLIAGEAWVILLSDSILKFRNGIAVVEMWRVHYELFHKFGQRYYAMAAEHTSELFHSNVTA